jgi:hypothetical protein
VPLAERHWYVAHREMKGVAVPLAERHLLKAARMGWVNDARKELVAGREVKVRPTGGSMRGRIESGQLVTLTPIDPAAVVVDDVVLVAWRGGFLLHLVKDAKGDQLLIGNNVGKINGWVPRSGVLGKVIAVED